MALANDGEADVSARLTFHLSLWGKARRGQGYNVADAKALSSSSVRWSEICACYRLVGEPLLAEGRWWKLGGMLRRILGRGGHGEEIWVEEWDCGFGEDV
jgi:hypothetical protein